MDSLYPEILAAGGVAIRSMVGALLLAAGASKVRAWSEFEGLVAGYQVLPEQLVSTFARVLPILELAIGALLILHLTVQPISVAAAALLLTFALAMGTNIARGRLELDCGCGGRGERISVRLVARNVMFAMLLLAFSATPLPNLLILTIVASLTGLIGFLLHQAFQLLGATFDEGLRGKTSLP